MCTSAVTSAAAAAAEEPRKLRRLIQAGDREEEDSASGDKRTGAMQHRLCNQHFTRARSATLDQHASQSLLSLSLRVVPLRPVPLPPDVLKLRACICSMGQSVCSLRGACNCCPNRAPMAAEQESQRNRLSTAITRMLEIKTVCLDHRWCV